MNAAQIEYAERKAKESFDRWNDVASAIETHSSTYCEVMGVIDDAVHIGIQMALFGDIKTVGGEIVKSRKS